MCQFLNKWKSEEAEAHPSQTSQESLAEFHLAVCSDSFFSLRCLFPLPSTSKSLHSLSFVLLCSPNGRRIITTMPTAFAFTPFQLARAKTPQNVD